MGKFDDIMEAVNKKYKGKYMTLGSDAGAFKMERLPTGILAIDAITYGGLPKGKIVVFWGNWSSAKTFTAFKTVARAQRTCKQCLAYMEDKGKTLDVVDRETGEILLTNDEAETFLDKMETMEELQQKKNVSESVKDFSKEEEKQLRGLRMWHGKHAIKDRPYRVNANKNIVCPKCACTEGLSTVWTAIEDFEPDFAKMAGVDISDLMIVRSEYAEQAIDISAEILRSGKCDLMVIDSVAMLTPAKEIEDSAEKFQQGLAARLINKALRRWTAGQTVVDIESNAGTKPTLILINQVRHKIGVMYGCFEYGAMVSLADGSRKKIGEIVKERLPVDVLSMENGKVVTRKVTGWHDNGPVTGWLKIVSARPKVMSQFKCTPGHKIMTPDGEVPASDLRPGSKILMHYRRLLSRDGENLILGMALGDGNLRRQGKMTAVLRVEHGNAQTKFCDWKARLLGDVVFSSRHNKRDATRKVTRSFRTKSSVEIGALHDLLYTLRSDGKYHKHFTPEIAARLTPLGMAIWYMDDGTLNPRAKWGRDRCSIGIFGFDDASRQEAKKFFVDRGMACALHGGVLTFTPDGAMWLQKEIGEFVPPSMQYKLSEEFRGYYCKPVVDVTVDEDDMVVSEVLSVEKIGVTSKGGFRKATHRYDLTVDGSACYFVSDVLVHNSPDVMPGGKGQTFANSLVLKFRGGKKTKNEDTGETVNHVIHVKVEKSKVSPPDEQGDFVIWLREHKGNYPGTTSEPKIVFETAIKEGVILKVKNSYMLGGKKYATQKAAIAALTTDSLLLDATRTMILDRMNDRRLRHA